MTSEKQMTEVKAAPTNIENTKYDFLGRPLSIGDYVLTPSFGSFNVCVITGLTGKMIRIKKVLKESRTNGTLEYSKNVLLVDESQHKYITLYMLKQGK